MVVNVFRSILTVDGSAGSASQQNAVSYLSSFGLPKVAVCIMQSVNNHR